MPLINAAIDKEETARAKQRVLEKLQSLRRGEHLKYRNDLPCRDPTSRTSGLCDGDHFGKRRYKLGGYDQP